VASNFLPREFAVASVCFDEAVPWATGWRDASPECEFVFCADVAFARELVGCNSTSFCQLCCGHKSLRIRVHSRFQIFAVKAKERNKSNITNGLPQVDRQPRFSAS